MTNRFFYPSVIVFLFSCLFSVAQSSISLAGKWMVTLDPDSSGIEQKFYSHVTGSPITLPGTLDEAGYGEKTVGPDYGILSRKNKFIGAAWYNRTIEIPAGWQNSEVLLYLERVMWQSKVWVDGKYISMQDGLGTPHYHNLGKLTPGKHVLSIRVNNEMIYNIGDKGHSYGEYTQIIWNGMIGKIELQPQKQLQLRDVNTFPDVDQKKLMVSFIAKNETGKTGGSFRYRVIDNQTGKTIADVTEKNINPQQQFSYSKTLLFKQTIKTWDEFSPNLYTLKIEWKQGNIIDEKNVSFGFRKISTSKSKILVNNQPVFMRGNLDCVHFPLTGYPSTNQKEWERIFKIYKTYGLNHVRFHSWCPPEAAFAAADKLGIYIQAEVLWIDWWMSVVRPERPEMTTKGLPKGLGFNPSADAFVPSELERMLSAYGNHPSFALLCIGNELGNSDFTVMQKWIEALQQKDNRRLYSVSTARKIMPVDQYMVTHNIPGVGGTYALPLAGTDADLEKNYSKANIPIIAHEVGQFPVYPLWSEIDKYTGVLEARNLVELKKSAAKNGLLDSDKPFHDASGALQTILYKALIENSYRTASCAGFEMLSMTDYPGQGEALIGWLDAFWDSKGIVTPQTFRNYAGSVVPLARYKTYTWETKDTFAAQIQVANYSKEKISGPVEWKITDETGRLVKAGNINAVIESGKLNDVGSIRYNLAGISKAAKYSLQVSLKNNAYRNQWDFWVYPPVTVQPSGILIKEQLDDEALKLLASGGKVLLLAHKLGKDGNVTSLHFLPLFWSTSFFPGQDNKTLGMLINSRHSSLKNFPTENFTNWQWQPISNGHAFIVNGFDQLDPIIQPISDFHINNKLASLFECKIGKGKLMVCGYDITGTSPVAKQMKYSLLEYMQQPGFDPQYSLSVEKAKELFAFTPTATATVPAGFENALLYISCGAAKKGNGSAAWQKNLDKAEILQNGFDYNVSCEDVWKDEKGTAWTGKEIVVEIKTPNGIIGDLYVKFEDWNKQNRAGIITLEGREFILQNLKGNERWVKLFVMREDTNKGQVTFRAKVTNGGNLMISKIAFVK